MYCNGCGARLPDGTSVCEKCGSDMSRPGAINRPPPVEVKPGIFGRGIKKARRKKDAAKKSNKGIGVACIIVGVLVALLQLLMLGMYLSDISVEVGGTVVTQVVLDIGGYALMFVGGFLLVLAGQWCIKPGGNVVKLMIAASIIAAFCFMWNFYSLVFLIIEGLDMGLHWTVFWIPIAYTVVVVAFMAFSIGMSMLYAKRNNPNWTDSGAPL